MDSTLNFLLRSLTTPIQFSLLLTATLTCLFILCGKKKKSIRLATKQPVQIATQPISTKTSSSNVSSANEKNKSVKKKKSMVKKKPNPVQSDESVPSDDVAEKQIDNKKKSKSKKKSMAKEKSIKKKSMKEKSNKRPTNVESNQDSIIEKSNYPMTTKTEEKNQGTAEVLKKSKKTTEPTFVENKDDDFKPMNKRAKNFNKNFSLASTEKLSKKKVKSRLSKQSTKTNADANTVAPASVDIVSKTNAKTITVAPTSVDIVSVDQHVKAPTLDEDAVKQKAMTALQKFKIRHIESERSRKERGLKPIAEEIEGPNESSPAPENENQSAEKQTPPPPPFESLTSQPEKKKTKSTDLQQTAQNEQQQKHNEVQNKSSKSSSTKRKTDETIVSNDWGKSVICGAKK